MGVFRTAATKYTTALRTRPLLVKTGTGMVMAGTGDLTAQAMERKRNGHGPGGHGGFDWRRFAAFTAYGACWTGPVNHVWLPFLHQRVQGLGRKLLVQHGLFNPLVYLPSFFYWNGTARGLSQEETLAYAKERYWGSLAGVVLFWVPVTAVVFSRVPESLQSVGMAGISLVWNTLFSFLANSAGLSADGLLAQARSGLAPLVPVAGASGDVDSLAAADGCLTEPLGLDLQERCAQV